jgi:hypothetical protein
MEFTMSVLSSFCSPSPSMSGPWWVISRTIFGQDSTSAWEASTSRATFAEAKEAAKCEATRPGFFWEETSETITQAFVRNDRHMGSGMDELGPSFTEKKLMEE